MRVPSPAKGRFSPTIFATWIFLPKLQLYSVQLYLGFATIPLCLHTQSTFHLRSQPTRRVLHPVGKPRFRWSISAIFMLTFRTRRAPSMFCLPSCLASPTDGPQQLQLHQEYLLSSLHIRRCARKYKLPGRRIWEPSVRFSPYS